MKTYFAIAVVAALMASTASATSISIGPQCQDKELHAWPTPMRGLAAFVGVDMHASGFAGLAKTKGCEEAKDLLQVTFGIGCDTNLATGSVRALLNPRSSSKRRRMFEFWKAKTWEDAGKDIGKGFEDVGKDIGVDRAVENIEDLLGVGKDLDFGSLGCKLAEGAVGLLFKTGSKAVSQAMCVADDTAIAAACEAVGLGPEDPAADVCAVLLDVAFETACTIAVKEGSALTSSAVKNALHCGRRRLQEEEWRPTVGTEIVGGTRRLESIGCDIVEGAIGLLFKGGSKAVTEATCVGYDVAVDAACELIGLGPEDPAADACAVILDIAIETACQAAVKAGSTLTEDAVKKALKC